MAGEEYMESKQYSATLGQDAYNVSVNMAGNEDVVSHKRFGDAVTDVSAATHDVTSADYILNVSYTATGAVTITISSAFLVEGYALVIKDSGGNASANAITIDPAGATTIDGAATNVISTDYGVVTIYTDGTSWFVA